MAIASSADPSDPRYPRPQTREDLARNLAAVRERIAAAAERSGRCPQAIRLLPVTKPSPNR